jgi:transposase-like protein
LWIPHIDGIPTRKLANEYNWSPAQIYARLSDELNLLPDNNTVTEYYCDPNKYSGILIVDGKFIKIRGYKHKIPFIYTLDYLTHDIPIIQLSSAENESSFLKIFEHLKDCDYPLKIVVCDDRSTLQTALKQYFPNVPVQLCLNHYVENIRLRLHIRTDLKHRAFFYNLIEKIFENYINEEQLFKNLDDLTTKWQDQELEYSRIITDIYLRRKELFAYVKVLNCPNNTNLIELYNSHLNGRLKTIKGFKSFATAQRWLNAYTIRRRTKQLTDCEKRFKHLNGKTTLQLTLKELTGLPEILGVKTL